ncbi:MULTISPECIES: hypothetical protein [Vibrio]|uniref:hypothetical protein n=1 Tax=Vibrio TaxID=662 RepID=UPI0004E2EB46|nr:MULTISPECIES: hypothetical protein [Vibrio]EJL6304706.1 hypothetical protein [Vibrio cholerae]KFE10648.1 hypothetical protein DN36_200 [Vibrio cholerae]TXY22937.1 hypothetical protein FXE90_09945 [Vibrio cholerae]TXZ77497.1 hypothetical protein FXE32_17615 [Vibrio cholerae]GHX75419.1 hypothetical protein VCSRO110_0668 [Vibrio cholerae]
MKGITTETLVLVDKSLPFRSLLVKVNAGGSLQLQYELDGERITAQTFTTTGHYELVILRPCYLVPNNAKFSVV